MCGYRLYAVDGADNLAALVPDRPDGFDLGTQAHQVAGLFFVSEQSRPLPYSDKEGVPKPPNLGSPSGIRSR